MTNPTSSTTTTTAKGVIVDRTPASVIRTEHHWVIDGFPALKETMKNRDLMESPHFVVCPRDDIRCYLNLYPNGYNAESEGHCSVFLWVSGKPESIETSYSFAILDRTNAKKAKYNLKRVFKASNPSGWGTGKFISGEALLDPANQYLSGGDKKQLTIVVELEYTPSMEKTETALALFGNYAQLLLSKAPKQLTDMILVTPASGGEGGKGGDNDGAKLKVEHQVHRLVLVAHSPVFAAMFTNGHENVESRTGRVEIEDIQSEVVGEMVRFLYTGQIEPGFRTDLEQMERLLVAADKYQIEPLKRACEQVIGNGLLTADNAIEVLAFAKLYSSTRLQASAVKFIAANEVALLAKLTVN